MTFQIKAQLLQTEIFNLSDKIKEASTGPQQAQLIAVRKQAEGLEQKKRELVAKNDALYNQIRQFEKSRKDHEALVDEGEEDSSISKLITKNSQDVQRKELEIKRLAAEAENISKSNLILVEENEKIEKILVSQLFGAYICILVSLFIVAERMGTTHWNIAIQTKRVEGRTVSKDRRCIIG